MWGMGVRGEVKWGGVGVGMGVFCEVGWECGVGGCLFFRPNTEHIFRVGKTNV